MATVFRTSVGVLVSATLAVAAKVRIDAMEHDIQLLTAQNFDGVVSKFRDSSVSAVWYFNEDKKEDAAFVDEYNKVAGDFKGMAKIAALSCSDFSVFCKKQGIATAETPVVMIYPPNPIPAFKFDGKLESKAIGAKVARFMPDMTVALTADNADAFLTTDPTKPKVILFSNKKSPPLILKALSSETVFKRTIKFGFVPDSEASLVERYKIKKFPTIILQRGAKAEIKEQYKGEMNFLALKEWVNLHSESGMGDKVAGAKEEVSIEEAKPWLVQDLPELTAKSSNDICFKGEGLCVIYLKDGDLTAAETTMLMELSKKFTSQLSDRGAKMKWMWLNLGLEPAYKDLFQPSQLPSALVFNPHKRLRFVALDHGENGEVKADVIGITKLLETVLGGDARFKMVPGQKLPAWAQRSEKAKDTKKEL